jgi:hypothetical protein
MKRIFCFDQRNPMTIQLRPYTGKDFGIKWVSANIIAITISISLFYVGGMILFGGVFGGGSLLLIILGIPAIVGKSQSLVLDKYVDWFGWTGITIGGWAFGCLIIIFIGADALFSAWAGVLLGITVGVAQWSIMNRYIHRHTWWIATNIVAVF